MEEELHKLWKGFTLTEQESGLVRVEKDVTKVLVAKGKRCLLMMINADRVVNKEALRTTMSKVWRPEGWIQFKEVGNNGMLVEFQHESDKTKVLQGRPWSFDRSLVCLQEIDGQVPLNEVVFTKEPFWVQAHDMPMACMTKEVGMELFSGMEAILEVETDEGGCGWGCSLRAKVEVDITKPLIRGRFLTVDNVKRWIPFKYERLPAFCFACGSIKHVNLCSGTSRYNKQDESSQYGPWLRAIPVKPNVFVAKRYGGETTQKAHHNHQEGSSGTKTNEETQKPGIEKVVELSKEINLSRDVKNQRGTVVQEETFSAQVDDRGQENCKEPVEKQVGGKLKKEVLLDTRMKQEILFNTKKEGGPKQADCSLASQIRSLDNFMDQQIKALAENRQNKRWKRRARDRSVPLDSHLFIENSKNGGNKRKVEPGFLPVSKGNASKQLRISGPCGELKTEELVVAARQHHQHQ
ncbi:uncharacterized protein LOC122277085 [Carya illinoinensis]|uniref:uncharacterized protein LOC122277085 n=1 Tax=Carya illinoinensis TaxID=32201 RepID=UPI001C71D961|nr:uncharacterized protein LOC122277085 [Carya illinoinensis]